jgi:nucleoside-diphosphate-sugar epimerase
MFRVGCTGIIHTASPVLLSGDPDEVITPAKATTTAVLEAAMQQKAVKRFVFTSSTSACAPAGPKPSTLIQGQSTWNDEMVTVAEQLEPPWAQENCMIVYEASKVLAERTLWDFAKTRQPHFEVNTVLPSFCLSLPLDVVNQGFTSSLMVTKMYLDGIDGWQAVGPMWCVDIRDAALLRVAALIHPEVRNERTYGCADPWSWNIMAERMKQVAPWCAGEASRSAL